MSRAFRFSSLLSSPALRGAFSLDCFPTINSLSPLCEANDERAAYHACCYQRFSPRDGRYGRLAEIIDAVVRFAAKLHSPKRTKTLLRH